MANITHNNHYLSQMYLKNFSYDGKNIYVYNLLVPNSKCPLWESKCIKNFGSIKDIYTTFDGEEYHDELEKMFASDIESPAKKSLDKAVNGEILNEEDNENLSKFIALHIVRSPAVFTELMEYANEMLPLLVNSSFDEDKIKVYKKFNDIDLPFKETDEIIQFIVGKSIYLKLLKIFNNKCNKLFKNTKFSLVEFDNNVNIPISDNPVVVVSQDAFNRPCYDKLLINNGSLVFFPVSPNKALLGVVGSMRDMSSSFNFEEGNIFKKMVLENPCGYFISKEKDSEIVHLCQREVNQKLFADQLSSFSDFNRVYFDKEVNMLKQKH